MSIPKKPSSASCFSALSSSLASWSHFSTWGRNSASANWRASCLISCISTVGIKSTPGLSTEPFSRNVIAQHWAWPVFVITEITMQHFHDRQTRIQTNQVCERERTHGVIHSELHYRIDRLCLGHALHQAEHRLIDHRHE